VSVDPSPDDIFLLDEFVHVQVLDPVSLVLKESMFSFALMLKPT
jgi:hypothetical protein